MTPFPLVRSFHLDPSQSFLNRTTVLSWIFYGENHQLTINDPLTLTIGLPTLHHVKTQSIPGLSIPTDDQRPVDFDIGHPTQLHVKTQSIQGLFMVQITN